MHTNYGLVDAVRQCKRENVWYNNLQQSKCLFVLNAVNDLRLEVFRSRHDPQSSVVVTCVNSVKRQSKWCKSLGIAQVQGSS